MGEKQTLTAVLTPDPAGGYVAQVVELPGAISEGETVEEALANVRAAAELHLSEASAEELAGLEAHPVTAPIQVEVA